MDEFSKVRALDKLDKQYQLGFWIRSLSKAESENYMYSKEFCEKKIAEYTEELLDWS